MNEVEIGIGRNNKLCIYKQNRVCCYDELARGNHNSENTKCQTPTLPSGMSSNRQL